MPGDLVDAVDSHSAAAASGCSRQKPEATNTKQSKFQPVCLPPEAPADDQNSDEYYEAMLLADSTGRIVHKRASDPDSASSGSKQDDDSES